MSHNLDEKALRRPGFTEGHRVALGDGQEWTFPKPVLRCYPAMSPEGRVVMDAQLGFDETYQELRDELVETDDSDGYNATRIQVQMAGVLLLRNYDLSNRQLRALLPLIPDDAANEAMWDALIPVIMANPPKPIPVGSEHP